MRSAWVSTLFGVNSPARNVGSRLAGGTLYAFGARPTESLEFPLIPTMQRLIDWKSAAPDDVAWFDQLVVGSTALKSKLKAKKRAVLDQAIRDCARPISKIKTALHKPIDDGPKEEWENE